VSLTFLHFIPAGFLLVAGIVFIPLAIFVELFGAPHEKESRDGDARDGMTLHATNPYRGSQETSRLPVDR